MSKPLVSIIIPCYNASAFISGMTRAFEQTYSNIELVLVDDCSRDDTWQKMQALKQEHPELPIVLGRNEKNMGPGATRNNGLKLSSGAYVCFWDADDWVEPTYVEKMVHKLELEEADFVCCAYFEHREGKEKSISIKYELMQAKNTEELRLLFKSFFYESWSKLVRREFLEQKQICFPALFIGEDECWTMQLILNAHKIALLDEPLYHYDMTVPHSLTKLITAREVNGVVALIEFQFNYLKDKGFPEPFFEALRKSVHNSIKYHWQRIETDPEMLKFFAQRFYAVCSKYGVEFKEDPVPFWARFRWYRLIPPVGFKKARTKAKKNYYKYDKIARSNLIWRKLIKLVSL